MNSKLITTATFAVSLLTLAAASAGMPDAYRVAQPSATPVARSATVRPYALTGDRDARTSRQRPWQQEIQRIGNKPEPRVAFSR